MLLVPKKITIETELFANSGATAFTVVLYYALVQYARSFSSQSIKILTAQKIAREVTFIFSAEPINNQHSLRYLINAGLLIEDDGGNYVFAEEIR